MQQPDYRDQSEAEVEGETEGNNQSNISETQKQEIGHQEQGEKESDDTLVSQSQSHIQSHHS